MVEIDDAYVERLLDEVTRLTGESRVEAVRRALEERRARLAPADRLSESEIKARLAALDSLQQSLALTKESAAAWVAEVKAERLANNPPGCEE